MTKKTLIIIDAQHDFMSPNGILTFDEGKGDEKLIGKMNNFINNLPVSKFSNAIVTQDTHNLLDYETSEESQLFPLHCHWNTIGWCLVFDRNILESKVDNIQYLIKDKFDMWDNDLCVPDKEILNNTEEVYIFGVASDFCVEKALSGFIDRGYKTTILKDLTRGINKPIQDVVMQDEKYLNALKNGQLKLLNSSELLKKEKASVNKSFLQSMSKVR